MSTLSCPRASRPFRSIMVLVALLWAASASAAPESVSNATIKKVAVTDLASTANPGVSCIQVEPPPPPASACVGNWIAILSNNKHLITASLIAKATGTPVSVFYNTGEVQLHCLFLAWATCSVISVVLN